MNSGGRNAVAADVFCSRGAGDDRVAGVTGRHDVYLVFRNASVTAEQALMLLTGVGFVGGEGGAR